MKVLVLRHGTGEYDDYVEFTDATFLVSDDFVEGNLDELRKLWTKTTWTYRMRNGRPMKAKCQTIAFEDWLAEQPGFARLEFVDVVT